jgi:four helix bundle protein
MSFDMPRDHRKLQVFQIADELAIQMYASTYRFPAEERFGLRSQLRRGVVSIATNLVEGSARESERDFLRFVDISFASAREVTYLTTVAHRLGYLDDASAAKLEEFGRRIQAALINLKAAIERSRPQDPRTLGP